MLYPPRFKVKEIVQKIAEARTLIGLSSNEKGLEQAKALLEEIQAEAMKLGTAMMGSEQQPDAALTQTAQEAQKAVAAVGHAVQAEVRKAPALPMWVVRLRRSLIVLSGVSSRKFPPSKITERLPRATFCHFFVASHSYNR